MNGLQVRDLSVTYDNIAVLQSIDLKCPDGQFVSVVGKSGAGKTSLLNAIAGFIPFQGTLDVPRDIGYVLQDHAVFPWMTVEKNVEFGLEELRSERSRRVTEVLDLVDMTHLRMRYPWQLSGGQIQRVALARSLAPNPQLLLLDEPYASLDHHTRESMQDWLLSVWSRDTKTVLFVTHNIEEAIYLADRVLVLEQGRFVIDVEVPFPRPRTRDLRFSAEFVQLKQLVLGAM
jgi:NitT/TauT family transport system ATP-binding protein